MRSGKTPQTKRDKCQSLCVLRGSLRCTSLSRWTGSITSIRRWAAISSSVGHPATLATGTRRDHRALLPGTQLPFPGKHRRACGSHPQSASRCPGHSPPAGGSGSQHKLGGVAVGPERRHRVSGPAHCRTGPQTSKSLPVCGTAGCRPRHCCRGSMWPSARGGNASNRHRSRPPVAVLRL